MRFNLFPRHRIYPVFVVLAILTAPAMSRGAAATRKPAILVTAMGSPGAFLIDPVLQRKLQADGYRVASLYGSQLTAKRLKLFNEVVLVHEYLDTVKGASSASSAAVRRLKSTYRMLLNYVHHGGGLLTFFDEQHYALKWKYQINWLLSPLGASMTREGYTERNPADIHILSLQHIAIFSTRNIAISPVTRGVHKLWYPGGSWDDTLRLGPAWQVMVRGAKSAVTASGQHSPPLLAVRHYGAGRIAVMACHSSFYVNNGYNRAYDNGWCFNHGNGLRLFKNLFNWLGASAPAAKLGGYHKGLVPPLAFKPAVAIENASARHWKAYPGVFGVYSTFSGGAYTVADYAAEARRLGLKFVAFTDRIRTARQWRALKRQCKEATTAHFVAIPGVAFRDVNGDAGCAVNISNWPLSSGIGSTTFVMTLLTTGRKYGGIFAMMHPALNPFHPQNLGGFNALEIFSRRGRATFSGALNEFLRLQAIPGYSLLPVVSQRVWTLRGLKQAARDGFKLYLYAPNLKKLRAAPNTGLVQGFTSDGPVIDTFSVQHMVADTWETYFLWQPGSLAHIHIKINDSVPLEKIALYSGRKLIRCFRPNGRGFAAHVLYPMAQEGPFYLVVKDKKGRLAYSNAIPTRNENYWNHYGSDRMNNYTNPILPDKFGIIQAPNGQRLGNGGLITYGAGWGAYLRFYLPVPSGAYNPQGYETGSISDGLANLRTYPRLFSPQTTALSNVAPQRDYALATRDVAVVKEKFRRVVKNGRDQPSQFLDAGATETWYRYQYQPYGYIIGLVKTHARVIADSVQLDQRPGVNVAMLGIQYSGLRGVDHFTYVNAKGKTRTGKINLAALHQPLVVHVGQGGYFTLWPDPFDGVALYSLSKGMTFEFGKEGGQFYLRAGYRLSGQVLQRGRKFAARFIVVEVGHGQKNPALWGRLSDLCGLHGTPAYAPRVLSGKLSPGGYIVNLAAAEGGTLVRFGRRNYELPNHILPLRIAGVNGNWSAGALTTDMHFYPGGDWRKRLYLGLQKYAGQKLFLGNPLICNHAGVELDIDHMNDHGIAYQLSNKASRTLHVTVRPAPASGIRPFVETVTLAPGATVSLDRKFSR